LWIGSILCHLFYRSGKVGGLQILRCQWLAVNDDSFAIDALTLEPSDFCIDGVHLNPLRAKPVTSMAKLDRFAYTGHSVLMCKYSHNWQDATYVLLRFGKRVDSGRKNTGNMFPRVLSKENGLI